jgi:uncharacterized protein YfaS (alpha-2-macroglobulin family)
MQGEVLHGRVIIRTPVLRQHVAIEDFIPAGTEIVNQNLQTEDQTLGNDTNNQNDTYGVNTAPQKHSWLAEVFSFSNTTGPKKATDGVLADEVYGNRNTTLETLYPSAVEHHDDRIFAYVGELAQGEYVYDYYLRALIPGTYEYLPLVASELYTPENFGRTGGSTFTITKK